jgi:hypothetical protein
MGRVISVDNGSPSIIGKAVVGGISGSMAQVRTTWSEISADHCDKMKFYSDMIFDA